MRKLLTNHIEKKNYQDKLGQDVSPFLSLAIFSLVKVFFAAIFCNMSLFK